MARFFIDRPIFAWVIALVIMLAGSLAIIKLPVAQYPSIAPPAVGISASYPGASAKTVEDSVTQIIEQNMTGLDHLLYMSSSRTPPAGYRSPSPSSRGPTPTSPRCRYRTSCSKPCRCCRKRCSSRGSGSRRPPAAS